MYGTVYIYNEQQQKYKSQMLFSDWPTNAQGQLLVAQHDGVWE